MDAAIFLPFLKKKIDQNNSRGFWPSSICDDIKCFSFHGVMVHTENIVNGPAEVFTILVKHFLYVQDEYLV